MMQNNHGSQNEFNGDGDLYEDDLDDDDVTTPNMLENG